ncbi:TonB-dependent receptor [Hydrogenophaga palleronii]|uniref:TonB-dependent receptor n=1 Tax=Hydrogenophaga palleronii TaxID=65655 RepID=UPI000A024CAD|nr:TonB-dependent receptor [Hydrogenophaga palleronii]
MTQPPLPRTAGATGHPSFRVLPLVAALLAVGATLPLASPAAAQAVSTSRGEALRPYAVEAGGLEAALNQFARQAGVLISFDAVLVRGLQSPGFQGHATVASGLASVLGEHPLVAQTEGPGAWRIRAAAPGSRPGQAATAGERASTPAVENALPTVEVRAQSEEELQKDLPYRSAGSRSHITRDRIEQFRGTSVGDIFQGTPGVLIGENRNSGGLDVNIRGMQGQGRVPVLVDGARQETTVYRGYAGVSSRSYVDPDLIGGIDIEKGPSMAAGGTGAVGGLVTMRTINAEDIVRPGQTLGLRLRGSLLGNNSGSAPAPGTPSGYNTGGNGTDGVFRINCVIASLCAGPFNIANAQASDEGMSRPGLLKPKSFAGSAAVAKRFEQADVVAAYAKRSQGNYYAGTKGPVPYLDLSDTQNRGFYTEVRPKVVGATRFRAGERIVNSNYDSESVLLKTKLYMPDDQELELSYLRYESTYGELMPSQLLWLGQVRQTSNSHVLADTYAARYRWNPVDSTRLDLRANLWHTDTTSENRNYSEGTWSNAFDIGGENYKRWGFDLSNGMRFDLGGDIKLNYGLSAQNERVRGDGQATNFSAGGRAGQRDEYSLFTDVQWKPVPSLTLQGGLRHTRFQSRDDKPHNVDPGSAYCVDPDGDGVCEPLMMSSRNSGTAPMVSLLWEPRAGLQFYARHAEALRMPSLFETTSGFSVSPSQDIHLKPEQATSREIGVNYLKDDLWRSGDKFRAKAAWFRNHTRDYLTRTFPNTWEEGMGTQFFSLRNIQSVTFHGFELSGSYDLGPAFLELSGTRYTFIETCHFGSYRRTECTDYGIAASYVNNMIPPKWHASATLGARLLQRKLTLGVRGTFMGQRTPTPAHNDQGVVSQGAASPVPWHKYSLWDLFASYKVNDQLSVDFNIDNVTDRYYLDALSLGLVPAPGRSARLSVTLRF